MSKLDRLCHLEKDMAMAAMQCDVVLAEEDLAGCPPLFLPLKLGFFNYEAKVKLQVNLAASLHSDEKRQSRSFEYALELLSCNVEYGKSGIQSSVAQLFAEHKDSGLGAIVTGISHLLK